MGERRLGEQSIQESWDLALGIHQRALRSRRLADELGVRALAELSAERSADGVPEVLRRARRLLAYYRPNEPVLPAWIESFVKAGCAHYCTLLPTAFSDQDVTVRQVAAMLGFLFSMESLALSPGCERAQLERLPALSQWLRTRPGARPGPHRRRRRAGVKRVCAAA